MSRLATFRYLPCWLEISHPARYVTRGLLCEAVSTAALGEFAVADVPHTKRLEDGKLEVVATKQALRETITTAPSVAWAALGQKARTILGVSVSVAEPQCRQCHGRLSTVTLSGAS